MWGPCCCDRVPLSAGVFTECYRKDEERAQKLLTRVSEAWGKTTCLQLALEAKDMKFVSHGGIQVTVGGPASRIAALVLAWTGSLRSVEGARVHQVPVPWDQGWCPPRRPSSPCLWGRKLMLNERREVSHLHTGCSYLEHCPPS